MFQRISISNFKSIRELEFTPRRVNVFIGEPSTGKTNIIEALTVFSEGVYEDRQSFRDLLRFKTPSELFYDRDVSQPAKVEADGVEWSLKLEAPQFTGMYLGPPGKDGVRFTLAPDGQLSCGTQPVARTRLYQFRTLAHYSDPRLDGLLPPFGANLAILLETNKPLYRLVDNLFQERGFRLVIQSETNELVLVKEREGRLLLFSYGTGSETFRRIVFYMAVLETNHDAVLLLDEPETNTFPFYTTYLAERIALDESNQFFLTTHNPYILGSIVGKTPVKELAVFVTTMEGFRTVLKPVSEDRLPLLLDYGPDAFVNLEKLVEA